MIDHWFQFWGSGLGHALTVWVIFLSILEITAIVRRRQLNWREADIFNWISWAWIFFGFAIIVIYLVFK
jgi:hypothetical protein